MTKNKYMQVVAAVAMVLSAVTGFGEVKGEPNEVELDALDKNGFGEDGEGTRLLEKLYSPMMLNAMASGGNATIENYISFVEEARRELKKKEYYYDVWDTGELAKREIPDQLTKMNIGGLDPADVTGILLAVAAQRQQSEAYNTNQMERRWYATNVLENRDSGAVWYEYWHEKLNDLLKVRIGGETWGGRMGKTIEEAKRLKMKWTGSGGEKSMDTIIDILGELKGVESGCPGCAVMLCVLTEMVGNMVHNLGIKVSMGKEKTGAMIKRADDRASKFLGDLRKKKEEAVGEMKKNGTYEKQGNGKMIYADQLKDLSGLVIDFEEYIREDGENLRVGVMSANQNALGDFVEVVRGVLEGGKSEKEGDETSWEREWREIYETLKTAELSNATTKRALAVEINEQWKGYLERCKKEEDKGGKKKVGGKKEVGGGVISVGELGGILGKVIGEMGKTKKNFEWLNREIDHGVGSKAKDANGTTYGTLVANVLAERCVKNVIEDDEKRKTLNNDVKGGGGGMIKKKVYEKDGKSVSYAGLYEGLNERVAFEFLKEEGEYIKEKYLAEGYLKDEFK
jgi:hypothetical protein